MTMKKKVGEY